MKKTNDTTNESINELKSEVETLGSYIRARNVDNVIARENSQLRATNQSLMETIRQLKDGEEWRVENLALLKDVVRKLVKIRANLGTRRDKYAKWEAKGLNIAIEELKKIWSE